MKFVILGIRVVKFHGRRASLGVFQLLKAGLETQNLLLKGFRP